jgi:hypothetical protein
MTKFILFALLSASVWAGDGGFDGRWNIHVKLPNGRIWWMEVKGAGTGKVEGSFVGVPGGQVDALEDAKVENGELTFTFTRGNPAVKQTYKARLAGNELRGTRVEEKGGVAGAPLEWRGVRAPVISEHDDGTWKPGRTVKVFDGKSTANWRKMSPEAPGWYVADGVMKNEKGASDIVSEAKFWNFEAQIEYRYEKGSNSGVGLRGRYEVQIFDNYGRPPNMHGNGALYSRIAPRVNASKAPGEWQTLTIRLVGRDLTVVLNGVNIIDRQDAVGPTAMACDPEEAKPGPLMLQGDHGLVEFRRIEVTELKK